jgi:hypothetical protein
MRRSIQIALGAIVAVSLAVGFSMPAHAVGERSTVAPSQDRAADRIAQVQAAFTALQPWFGGPEAGYSTFDAAGALAAGIDPQLVAETAVGFAAAGGTVIGAPAVQAQRVASLTRYSVAARSAVASAACAGVTKVVGAYPSVSYYVNACDVRAAQAVMGGSGTVGALIGKFAKGFGSYAAAVVAAIVGVALAVLSGCNARGRGIVLTTFLGYATGCRSQ